MQGGFTLLWIAAYYGHSEMVQELLTSKADLDHQDQVSVRACVCVTRDKINWVSHNCVTGLKHCVIVAYIT